MLLWAISLLGNEPNISMSAHLGAHNVPLIYKQRFLLTSEQERLPPCYTYNHPTTPLPNGY